VKRISWCDGDMVGERIEFATATHYHHC